jgi:hypothetical protein
VPGDVTSKTETITGENIYPTATGAPVLIPTGRHVYNSDMSELFFTAGRNGFIAAFFQGDPIQPHSTRSAPPSSRWPVSRSRSPARSDQPSGTPSPGPPQRCTPNSRTHLPRSKQVFTRAWVDVLLVATSR